MSKTTSYNWTWRVWPDLAGVKDALPMLLDVYRGKEVPEEDLAFAMFNGGGFAYGALRAQGDAPIFTTASSVTEAEIEKAFEDAIAASKDPTAISASAAWTWIGVVAPIILDLFKKWLERRQ